MILPLYATVAILVFVFLAFLRDKEGVSAFIGLTWPLWMAIFIGWFVLNGVFCLALWVADEIFAQ